MALRLGYTEGDIDWPHMLKLLHAAADQPEIPYVKVVKPAKAADPVGRTTPGWLWNRAVKEWPATVSGQ